MKYIVRAKEIFEAIEVLAEALEEKDYSHHMSTFMVWEIGGKTYRILEPKECRVVAIGENFKPVLMYEYEIEEIGSK